jgi:hypothetical protein
MENNTQITEKVEIIGNLFETINYSSKEQLNLFIDNMNQDQALYCLKQAILACHNRGVFTLEESEAVSKSLRLLLT